MTLSPPAARDVGLICSQSVDDDIVGTRMSDTSSDDEILNNRSLRRTFTEPIGNNFLRRQWSEEASPQTLRIRREEALTRAMRLANICSTRQAGASCNLPGSIADDCVDVQEAASTSAESFAELPVRVNCALIFDWDDTLFPTWFATEVVMPCHPDMEGRRLPRESVFAAPLAEHAKVMHRLLCQARRIGRVGIVTLAKRPWVLSSAATFFLEFDFKQVLRDLEIPVVYARECLNSRHVDSAVMEEGVNVWTIAKKAAMLKILKKLHGRKSDWTNIISIGDSFVERDAIKDLLWCQDIAPYCKTVKMVEDPALKELSVQQTVLTTWLEQLASYQDDFDLNLDEDPSLNLNR